MMKLTLFSFKPLNKKVLAFKEKGSALLLIILMLLLLSLLGSFAFSRGMSEMSMSRNAKDETVVSYLAESGAQQIMLWFQFPEKFNLDNHFPHGYSGPPRSFFKRRLYEDNQTASFFFQEESQFNGTPQNPDLLISSPQDESFLNDPMTGLFAPLADLGRLVELKVYGPKTPGGLCVVESRAEGKSGMTKTLTVEFTESPLTPLRAPVQSGGGIGRKGVPLWTHWGEVWVLGNANLGNHVDLIPVFNPLSVPTSLSYNPNFMEDPWLHIRVEHGIEAPLPLGCPACSEPYLQSGHSNIHQNQGFHFSGFHLNTWDYEKMKRFAKRFGEYYSTDSMGNLYLDGTQGPQHKRFPLTVFQSAEAVDTQRLVFIDTIDQNPPSLNNLATITIPMDYTQGIFFVNADLEIENQGPGKTLSVLSPPLPLSEEPPVRVSLTSINMNGVLYSNGSIKALGPIRTFGTLIARNGFVSPEYFEVWHNHDHSRGRFPSHPTVIPLPGGWFEAY